MLIETTENAAGAIHGSRIRVTFGTGKTQTAAWSDERELSWPDLADLLTSHAVGPKEGPCIVPAVFRSNRRKMADAECIGIAMLDSDAGATLDQIAAAIRALGWSAIISSTHSHLTTRTTAKRGNWDKFCLAHGDKPDLEQAFLEAERSYLPGIADDAEIVAQTDTEVVFQHQPCPKFRITIPLLRPWIASSYDDQRNANAAWKERITALAHVLSLRHDQSCTDTSRLFYLPRKPAEGSEPETLILEGEPCDLFALPKVPDPAPRQRQTKRGNVSKARFPHDSGTNSSSGPGAGKVTFNDPDTGEIINLTAWARSSGQHFEIVNALRARSPGILLNKVAEGSRHHIRCPNEEAHTQSGADAATFIVNASESTSRGFVYHCRHAHCEGRDRLIALCQMLQQGWLSLEDLTAPEFLSERGVSRPTIRYIGGEITGIVDEAERALIQADLNIYQRGAFVVRPGRVTVSIQQGRTISAQRILEIGNHSLIEAMTVAADWEKFDARSESWIRIDAPLKVAKTFQQRIGRWRLPVLSGIINAPTLRTDGSILASSGYDRCTGLLMDTEGVVFPKVPAHPSHADALQSLAILEELIDDFPFVDPPSRAVALSAILTASIRRSLTTAPMHAFTAPTAGSGKSMLVDLASLIAAGREAGVISQGKTEEELEKRLGALLLAGDQVIAIDNCEAPLGGEFLCSMLTQVVVRPRILGRSEAPELPSNAMVTATGNNLILIGDMTRRAVLCRLDPKEERPELRKFATDPLASVRADRGRYVVAALTILRAYHVAGRPSAPNPLGSFKDWSNWVRGALLWVGHADPVDTIEAVRALDPKLDLLIAVLLPWRDVIGHTHISVADLIKVANAQRPVPESSGVQFPKLEFVHPEFREALLSVAGDGGNVNGKRLGKWFGAQQGRVVQGLRIVRRGLIAGNLRWQLEDIVGGPNRGIA